MSEANVVVHHIDPSISILGRLDYSTDSSWLVTSALIALAVPFSWRMISTVSFAAFRLTSAQSTFASSRANRTAAAFSFPQPGPTDQWGLPRQDAAPRNPHHCSTNCRDTMDARNTPWMGNKGRDIPEPDILRAVGMVKHCNSQHSAVLALGRMGGRMPRDQPTEPRPGLF